MCCHILAVLRKWYIGPVREVIARDHKSGSCFGLIGRFVKEWRKTEICFCFCFEKFTQTEQSFFMTVFSSSTLLLG